jgi:cytidine deaminase
MTSSKYEFAYEVYNDSTDLKENDAALLNLARSFTKNAYAPYSHFHVAAVARMANGETIAGTNQENASYPVGVCAERVLLGIAASLHPDVPIETMAISYDNREAHSDHPISPCGMCRQSLLEYEMRLKKPIRLILSGQSGKVFIISTASLLLPFGFTSDELNIA